MATPYALFLLANEPRDANEVTTSYVPSPQLTGIMSGQENVLQTNGKMSTYSIPPGCRSRTRRQYINPGIAPSFISDPLKLQESLRRRASTFAVDWLTPIFKYGNTTEVFPYRPLQAYHGFISTVGAHSGCNNRIPYRVHPRKNVQTARAFGSVMAPDDSEESYGVLLVPFAYN